MTNDTVRNARGEDVTRYVAKLQALLRHAEDRAGSPEGDTYQAKAFALMTKYGIDAAMAAEHSPTAEPMIRRVIEIKSIYAQQLQLLALGITRAVPGAHPLVAGKGEHRFVYVYGYESAVHSVTVIYASLRNQILGDVKSKRGWNHALRLDPSLIHKTSMQRYVWRREYVLGFAYQVTQRLKDTYRVIIDEAQFVAGTELALRDRNTHVQEWAESFASGTARPTTLRSRDHGAIRRGMATGETALLGVESNTVSTAQTRRLA